MSEQGLHASPPDGAGEIPARRLPPGALDHTFGLLSGVTVLDLTNSVAGPYATLLLADLGAEVLKIEAPGAGDDSRHWGPPFQNGTSLWFLSLNRNKQSITLDYGRPAGRDILYRLVEMSDTVVMNLRPGVQRKLGLDYESLRARRPDLIFCSITGFGLSGPKRELRSYDLIAEGYSGVMDLTGEPDRDPQKIGTPAADMLAGMDAAFGVIAALFDRERTGRGHLIDVSLVESMARFLTPRIVPYLGSRDIPRRSGGTDSPIAVYQTFHTADLPITLGLGNDAIFLRFCEAVERPEWTRDSRFASNPERRAVREELVALIQAELVKRPRAEWLERFRASGVPAGPINRVDEVLAEEQLAARGLFYQVPGEPDPVGQVGTGWHLDGAANGYRLPPPALGADTQEVLSQRLGMGAEELRVLGERGII